MFIFGMLAVIVGSGVMGINGEEGYFAIAFVMSILFFEMIEILLDDLKN